MLADEDMGSFGAAEENIVSAVEQKERGSLFPSFEMISVWHELSEESLLSVDCQSGIMALLSSRGTLVVRDMEEEVVLLTKSVQNPYRVFVHPYGSHVLAASLDGELYYYATYNAKVSTHFSLQMPSASSFLDSRGTWSPGSLFDGRIGFGSSTVLVAECVTWLRDSAVRREDDRTLPRRVRGAELLQCMVGTRAGGLVLLVEIELNPGGCSGGCSVLWRTPTVSPQLAIGGIAAELIGATWVVFVSNPMQLFRAEGSAASPAALLAAVEAGTVTCVTREVLRHMTGLSQAMRPPGNGAVTLFRPNQEAPAQHYAWASAAGVVHGCFRHPSGEGACGHLNDDEAMLFTSAESTSSLCVNEQLLDVSGLYASSPATMVEAGDGDVPSLVMAAAHPFPSTPPAQVLLTAFHMILRYDTRCITLNHPAGLTWRGFSSTYSGDQVALSEVLERVCFDPYRAVRQMKPLRDAVRDVAERRLYVVEEHHVWGLQIHDEHRQQWRLFLDRAVNPREGVALRRRFFDASYNLARGAPAEKNVVQFLRGKFYLSAGAVQCGTSVLADCDWFEEIYLYLTGLRNRRVLLLFLEKRFDLVIRSRAAEETLLQRQQLAVLIVLVVVHKLDHLASCTGTAADLAQAASSDLDHFIDHAVATCGDMFDQPGFVKLIMRLMEEQGKGDNVLYVLRRTGQDRAVVAHLVENERYLEAVETLSARCQSGSTAAGAWYEFASVLMERCPVALVAGMLKVFTADMKSGRDPTLDLERLLPALMRYSPEMNEAPGVTEHQVLELLEYCVRQHGTCASRAVANYHLYLLVECAALDRLEEFIRTSDAYDPSYVLRVCLEKGCLPAAVTLFKQLQLYEDAVKTALACTGTDASAARRAQAVAEATLVGIRSYEDEERLKYMWLLVAQHAIHWSGTRAALTVVENSGGVLQLEDVVSLIGDGSVVRDYKDAICRSLDHYTGKIAELQRKQEDAYQTSVEVKRELNALQQRYGYVSAKQRCPLCHRTLLQGSEPYVLYPSCGHVAHESCAVRRLEAIGGMDAFLTDEGVPPYVLDGARGVVDLVRADCVLCGEAAIVEIDIPLCEEEPSWRVNP